MRLLPMFFHQVLLQGKVEADRRQNYICKTNTSCPPRPKRETRSARREIHAPLEARNTPRPKRVTRPARREKYTPLGGRSILRSEGASPYVHREVLPTFGWSFSLHSKGCIRLTEFGFRQYFSSSLPAANLERTENKTISVKPSLTVRRGQ